MTAPAPSQLDANESGTSHGFQDYLRWFLRRYWIFLITVSGGLALGLYLYSITPPLYHSQATIEILRVKQEAADIAEEERLRMSGGAQMLSASERLRLPAIYIEAAKTPLFTERSELLPEVRRFPWTKQEQFSAADLPPEIVGGILQSWTAVRWRPDTTLLDLSAAHTDPATARDALVALITAFERAGEDRVADSSEYALEYILGNTKEIKDRLLVLDQTLRLYQRCSELSDEVREAQRQIAEMEKRYLPKWPPLVEAKELERLLKERFVQELDQALRLSEEERDFWDANLARLSGLTPDETVSAKQQLVATRSSMLMREMAADQQVYDNLMTKLKEGNISAGFASRQFEVVQPPTLPGRPSSPNRNRLLIQCAGGGGVLGIAIIFLLGIIDPTVRTVAELESLAGIPVVGAMPSFKNQKSRGEVVAAFKDYDSPSTEAIRSLRAGLVYLGTAEERCSFLVTSAIPGEGKSWVAANLALSFASQGERTLLIDADLRRPVQGEIFGFDKEAKGLVDQLSLGTPVKEVLLRCEASENLFLMPSGSRSGNPSELLAGKSLPGLVQKLSEYFDRIVIDSAPLVPVSDSLPLAKNAQSVVLVTRMGKTPKPAIRRALRLLTENRTPPVGLVANGLPKARTQGAYGYYYDYSGGGSYAAYGSYSRSET